jgi:DNA-binding MarR family transcriptional regulator
LVSPSEHAERVWFRWLRLQSRMEGMVAERLKALGLSVPQCDVLTTLTEREGISQQELAERLYVTKGNISGLIDRLAAAGLVERRSIAGDRRSHAIYLTAEGRGLAHQGIAIQRDFVAQTIGKLSAAQVSDFESLLIATRDHLRSLTGPSPRARR